MRDGNRTRELLEKAEFYCSSPRNFDDPHDNQLGAFATGDNYCIDDWLLHDMAGVPYLMQKYNLSSLTEISEQTVTDPEDRKIITAAALRRRRRHTRVLCLAGTWHIDLMWSFYADEHRGICLVFDANHDFFKAARPVLYTHSPVDVQHFSDSGEEGDRLAFCKPLAWQFQKEWRIVWPGDKPSEVSFPRESLKAVILGYRFLEPLFKDLERTLVNGGYNVDIHRVKRLPNSYDLALVPGGHIGPKETAP